MGFGSTSTTSGPSLDSRITSTDCCWSALRVVKNSRLPRTAGIVRASTRVNLASAATTRSRPATLPSWSIVYVICAFTQLRVSGASLSSSQRYGSAIGTPCSVSVTTAARVGGGAGENTASAAEGTAASSAASSTGWAGRERIGEPPYGLRTRCGVGEEQGL